MIGGGGVLCADILGAKANAPSTVNAASEHDENASETLLQFTLPPVISDSRFRARPIDYQPEMLPLRGRPPWIATDLDSGAFPQSPTRQPSFRSDGDPHLYPEPSRSVPAREIGLLWATIT
jgi:hypothetical protein